MGSVANYITGEIRERSELEFRIRTASGEIRWWRGTRRLLNPPDGLNAWSAWPKTLRSARYAGP